MSFAPFSLDAPAKVNLALHVLGRRADGYHDLDSLVAFADRGDRLDVAPADSFALSLAGPFAAALPSSADNIVARAWALGRDILAARGLMPPGAAIRLTKNLPVASGIGGGSADAAATLRALMNIAGVAPDDPEVRARALALGADVPVCLMGRACRMRGVGDRLAEMPGFRPRAALLVNPGVAVSTPDVFARLGLARGDRHGAPIGDPDRLGDCRNDLAAPAIALAPAIGEVLDWLRSQPGVAHAAMSGSGATCYALMADGAATPVPPKDWWLMRTVLR